MEDSFFVWIGSSPPDFKNLAVAVQSRFERQPLGNSLMGDLTDPSSSSLAQKLAKKTNKQVFVSCNLTTEPMMLSLVEKRLFEEMKALPEKF
ncbi:Proteasome assembly chaperone 4 [Lamellibrachia satsuma]|nr:Proteasome assembly chaperone 4 [Lamellibrachia satsuma]